MAHYLRAYQKTHTNELATAQVDGAVTLAGTPPDGDVLDAPCGAGRHSRALAASGHHVTGVDSSQDMLDAARAVHAPAGVQWVRADYRDLPFRAGTFDTVLNLFTSFGFCGDDGDQAVLDEFQRVLRPGGRLVMDTTHRDRVISELAAKNRTDVAGQAGETTWDVHSGWMHMSLLDRTDGHRSVSRIRVYTPSELDRMLVRAGFREVSVFGGLDGRPLGRRTRLVVVAA
ncbi:class I SAM-dependent methyltransferase [Actinoplanes rectilineatus]|uniref:class I SAM-dependent methyltransferase n=1 Tax=Actinoplanes rectilineatus TaxID=113571 RepID=UPI00069873F7|nr:class I SAM-dependent methyltransferase [Actinoplanes rectilineatus]